MNGQWPGLWYRPGLYLSGKDRYTLQSEAGVKISFGSESLREICEKKSVATRKFGLPSAKKLVSRLADLQAASCVTDLPAGKPHPLKRDRLGQYAVWLAGGHRLCFEPTNDPVPVLETGQIDWGQVTEVRIVYIGDYHD